MSLGCFLNWVLAKGCRDRSNDFVVFATLAAMQKQQKLIELLSRSETVSGSALGEALGMSRMGVQKRIQQLIENGLPVQAVPGKGYSLARGVSLLNGPDIERRLEVGSYVSVEVMQSIASTNSYLLSQSVENSNARICAAETQSAGRGRRGNDWQSAPYRNVMMSISWGFDHWPETITGLGLAVSLAISEYLNERYEIDVRIKWPNDLMVGDDKLGGILIDVSGEASSACQVVIGLGLNVHQPDWSNGGAYKWQDLASLGVQVDRNELVGHLSAKLISMLQVFNEVGFAPMVDRWNALSSYAGLQVRVGGSSEYIEGEMRTVDAAGALIVESDDGVLHRFADSNVSVRLVSMPRGDV